MTEGTRTTLEHYGEGRYEEKRSVFIACAYPVTSEEEAREALDLQRKRYHDAKHHVFAYVLSGTGTVRYSDDGEPQGTGGLPVLGVIKGAGLTDVMVVVTRYFGGILLGTGGLSRAYSAAAKDAVSDGGRAEYRLYNVYRVTAGYSEFRKLSDALKKSGAAVYGEVFETEVSFTAASDAGTGPDVPATVTEITGGRGRTEFLGTEERVQVRTGS